MNREYNFDYLRAFSCIFVVIMHVAAIYTESPLVYNKYPSYYFSYSDFYQMMTRTAVPCFVMMSGAFLIGRRSYKDIKGFYIKSLSKLLWPTIIFGVLALVYRFLSGIKIKELIIDTVSGKPMGHFWYVFMTVGLYIITPVVDMVKNIVSKENFIRLGICLIMLQIIVRWTCKLIWPIEFIEYLGYYIIGYCIKNNKDNLKKYSKKLMILIAVVFLSISYLMNEVSFYCFNSDYNPVLFRSAHFPTIIIASIVFFMLFSVWEKKNINVIIRKISETSFVIYLCHPLVYGSIQYVLVVLLRNGKYFNPVWYVPVLSFVTLFLSIIISDIYSFVLKNIDCRKIQDKIIK